MSLFRGSNTFGMDRGCFFFNQTESDHHMPFLSFLGIVFASMGLIKLGAMSVMVGVLSSAIGVLLLIVVGLVLLIALRYIKKP